MLRTLDKMADNRIDVLLDLHDHPESAVADGYRSGITAMVALSQAEWQPEVEKLVAAIRVELGSV